MLCLNISYITIITAKNIDCRCIIHNISKFEANNLLESAALEKHGYIYINIVSIPDSFFFTFFVNIYIKWLISWISISL